MHTRQRLGVELRQALAQFDQAGVEVAGNTLDRQLADLVDDAFELLLQLFQVARDGGDAHGALVRVERDFFRLGVEVQGDVELAGQQVTAASLGAQAVFDEGPDQAYAGCLIVRVIVHGLEQLGVGLAEQLRVDHDADIDRKGALFRIEIQVDRHNPAELDAEKLHRCVDFQPAQGLIEAQDHVLPPAVGRGEGALLVFEQFKAATFFGRFVIGVVGRRLEGNPPHQHGRQGFGFQRKAIGTDAQVDAAGIPEPRVLGDVHIIGRMHEDFDIHALALVVQLIGHHLAHRDLAVIDGGADVQGTQGLGVQGEALARLAVGDGRRVFQAGEVLGAGLGLTDVRADIVAGQQRVDARHAACANARAHHPEFRIFAGEAFGLFDQLDGGIDAFLVITQSYGGYLADHHVAVFDLGFVGNQPAAGLEVEDDGRPLLHDAVNHQRDPHQYGDNRHDPDQRDTETTRLDHGLPRRGVSLG